MCRNLRFDGAREQGLTEDYVEQIVDGYEKSELPDRWKDAVRWTDAVIGYPASVTAEERDAVAAEFSPAEFVELTLTAAIAQGFSKSVVAWAARATCPPPSCPRRPPTAW